MADAQWPSLQRLKEIPLARVTALAAAFAACGALVVVARPSVLPATEAPPVATAAPKPETSAPLEGEPTPESTTEDVPLAVGQEALPSLVAALTAKGDAHGTSTSAIPRPAGSTRLYQARLDGSTTLTVYQLASSPAAALDALGASLEPAGFSVRAPSGAREATEATAAPRTKKSASSKLTRTFERRDIRAFATANEGEDGALLTIVETEIGSRP